MEASRSSTVAAAIGPARYNREPPFHPHGEVPECPFAERSSSHNPAYDAVRQAFLLLGLDADRFGTAEWNPLGSLVSPGDTVLLKPNFVVDQHPRDPDGLEYTVTHGSVIRAVADYVAIALAGRGAIVVADAPQTDSSFARIVEATGLAEVERFFRTNGVSFEIRDLRAEEWVNKDGVIVDRLALAGDPLGYSVVDVAHWSCFVGYHGEGRYYGADYDTKFVNEQHRGNTHRYSFSNTALDCDVFINLPKLKTHKKGGLTCSLKNLVGINGDKNYLPHHTIGAPSDGGDQFRERKAKSGLEHVVATGLRNLSLAVPALGTRALRVARKVGRRLFGDTSKSVRSGNWHGNNTVWRMTLDMNRVLLFWDSTRRRIDPTGSPKRYLSVVDAVIAGEGNGPMDPDPRPFGVVIAGANPAEVDAAATILMGFDPDRIPTVREAFSAHDLRIARGSWRDVRLASNEPAWACALASIDVAATPSFEPHFGWKNYLERRAR